MKPSVRTGSTQHPQQERLEDPDDPRACPKCSLVPPLDVRGPYICIRCNHRYTVEASP